MSRRFSGLDTGICSLGSSSTLNPTTAMTFACWAWAVSFPHAYNVIIKRIDAGTHYYAFQPKSTGKLALFYVDSNNAAFGYDGNGPNTMSTGRWYHIGFVLAANGKSWGFIDGQVDYTLTLSSVGVATISATTYLSFDASTSNTGWNGYIADAAIYNAELTLAEVGALYNGARPYQIRPASLVGYWPLDGIQSPEPDLSGNANNGTLTGTTAGLGPPVTMFTPRWPLNTPVSAAPSTIFRKTASRIGTRTGTRQTWAA